MPNIEPLQRKLVTWIGSYGYVSYSQLQKACSKLMLQQALITGEDVSSFFFSLVAPLLRTGIVEYGEWNHKSYFFLCMRDPVAVSKEQSLYIDDSSPHRYSFGLRQKTDEVARSLDMLCSLPSVEEYVNSFTEEKYFKYECLHYRKNLITLDNESFVNKGNLKVGLYKVENKPYEPTRLIMKDGTIRTVPMYLESLNGFSAAALYAAKENNLSILEYSKQNSTLKFTNWILIPYLIFRPLLLLDFNILKDETIYTKGRIEFHNIDSTVIKELERILGCKAKVTGAEK